jgi:hypothetical protein
MEQFVFKTFTGYFSGRKTIKDIEKYKKYKVGVTNNNIPIYRWNVGMILKSKNVYVDSHR